MRIPKLNPPLKIYGGIYAGCIFAFALLYSFMPGQFYAPYARLEPTVMRDYVDVQNIFYRAFQNALSDANVADEARAGGFLFNSTSLAIRNIETPDATHYKVSLQIGLDTGDHDSVYVGTVLIDLPEDSPLGVKMFRFDSSLQWDEDRTSLFYQTSGISSETIKARLGRLAFDRREIEILERYMAGVQGDPTALNDGAGRMLYFSAVVITTVGFGDIVPLTGLARLATAFESILGIVIVGLFINSATSAPKSSSDSLGKGLLRSRPKRALKSLPKNKLQRKPRRSGVKNIPI